MRFTRTIPIVSLMLSILVLWQPTLADSRSSLTCKSIECDWRKASFTPTISSIINKAQYGLDKLLRQGRKKSIEQ